MPIVPYDLRALAETATGSILTSLLAGIAIAFLAWAVTSLFGRRGAGTRFAVWFSALTVIAILPWIRPVGVSHGYSADTISQNAVTLPSSFAYCLFGAWIIGAVFGLVRVGFGLYRLRQLRSTCTLVDLSQLDARLRSTLDAVRSNRRVKLCVSHAVRVPAAMGYFRPIVVFPVWAMESVPPEELDALLVHELAHLCRRDDWTNLAQKIVKAVFFFHPAVWFIDSRLTLEREMACDDTVLDANFSPRAYAQSLLGLAEQSFLRRGVQLVQAAVSHVNQLKVRIDGILSKNRKGSARVWKPAVAIMVVAGTICTLDLSRGPSLIAFSDGGSPTASSTADATDGPLPVAVPLRPVNASFTDTVPHRKGAAYSTSVDRTSAAHRYAPNLHAALAQGGAQNQFIEDDIALPRVLLSNSTEAQNSVAPSAVLVVVRGEQFGAHGAVLWQLTIIHLTKQQERIVEGRIPRKI